MSQNPRSLPRSARTAALVLLAASATACASLQGGLQGLQARLPWRAAPAPAPTPVTELAVELPAGPQVPVVLQFREGDTLVVDLQGAAAAGQLTLRPGESGRWPVRLALRAQPGRFEVIEVRGAQRVRLPISSDRGQAVTVPLAPPVHAAGTLELRLSWGAAADDLR
jgi:hypothetical protein